MKEIKIENEIDHKVKSDLLNQTSANLLEVPAQENWLKKHALEPFIKSALIEPASVVTQFLPESKQAKIQEEKPRALSTSNMAEGLTEMAFSMAGSALVYGTMAALTKKAGFALAGKSLLDTSMTSALTSNAGSMIAGAAIYDLARKPHEGETRLGNAAAGAVAFAVFGGGHHLIADKGTVIKLASLPLIGAIGGLAQKQTSIGISQQRWLTGAEIEQSAVQGALLNSFMPLASKGISRLLEQSPQKIASIEAQKPQSSLTSPLKSRLDEINRVRTQELLRQSQPLTAENRLRAMEELRERATTVPSIGRGTTAANNVAFIEANKPFTALSRDSVNQGEKTRTDFGLEYKARPTEKITSERRYESITPQIKEARDKLGNTLNSQLDSHDVRELKNALTDLKYFSESTRIPERMRVKTILEINALVSQKAVNTNLSQVDRALLGSDVLKNITLPYSCITQLGGTCIVASYEVRLASLYPDRYANLIRQVATNGTYRALDGSTTHVPSNSISNADTRLSGNHASRLFQVTLPNIAWQASTKRPDGTSVRAGSLVYEMPGTNTYLMDYSSGKRGVPLLDHDNQIINSPYLNAPKQTMINDKIVGHPEIFQITRARLIGERPYERRGSFQYKSQEHLQRFLQEVSEGKRKDARFPLLIDVDADRIQRGLRKTFTGEPAMNHVATLLSYDSKTGKVEMNNTWSRGNGDYLRERAISMEKLWKALPRPKLPDSSEAPN